jgi:hypothetical protein
MAAENSADFWGPVWACVKNMRLENRYVGKVSSMDNLRAQWIIVNRDFAAPKRAEG